MLIKIHPRLLFKYYALVTNIRMALVTDMWLPWQVKITGGQS